ncbi:MAG TPA: ParB/RepB/Spo0J family partition protein [Pyrinomonadaceae bacterium]|jgi:ParB-like chromosome segregation protein Spo0J
MATETLQEIHPDTINPNPQNPRLIFREEEMNQLLISIKEVGIRVPLSVYHERGSKFTLIDGERRWRCARKLNLTSVPVIVYPRPSPLENLLMMFNIHKVRSDWDIMPMALKLDDIRGMLEAEGKDSRPKALAAITGVALPTIRRALDLLALPKKYQDMLLKEAEKPRGMQRIKPDLFIEINKSLHVVENYTPRVFNAVTKTQYVHAMVEKYVDRVVDNVTSYREVAKIARAELTGINKSEATKAIVKLVQAKGYSIEQAYQDTVEYAYEQRDLASRLRGITEKLTQYKLPSRLSDDVRTVLTNLRDEIDRLLGG